ncbi:hypothetical protein EVAR_13469_1 [Eumeta japonica]|uniref:Uncharacterized protein n=1 Tax=Eumeta variegata TaxID=151549 RepID=A0A4C1UYN3_EUMVA|nr:hypothetical protein EVAR_13469_1 [Eumeta japonica]
MFSVVSNVLRIPARLWSLPSDTWAGTRCERFKNGASTRIDSENGTEFENEVFGILTSQWCDIQNEESHFMSARAEPRVKASIILQEKDYSFLASVFKGCKIVVGADTAIESGIGIRIESETADGNQSETGIEPNCESSVSVSLLSPIGADISTHLMIEMSLLQEEIKAARTEIQKVRSATSRLTSTVGACNSRISDLAARVEAIESLSVSASYQ